MKLQTIILLIFFNFFQILCWGNNRLEIIVLDEKDNMPISNAEIILLDENNNIIKDSTDNNGICVFNINKGKYRINLICENYDKYVDDIEIEESLIKKIYLKKSIILLEEIVIKEEKKFEKNPKKSLKEKELSFIPSPSEDIIFALRTLPGVNTFYSPSSYLGGLYIRGGSEWENGYYVDDLPIPSIFHPFTSFTIISYNLIDSIGLYFGGAPVNFPGHIGSVIGIKTKDLLKNPTNIIESSIDILQTKFFGIYTFNNNFAIAGSFRKSIIDYLFNIFNLNNPFGITFMDYNIKLEYKPNISHKIEILMIGRDDFHIINENYTYTNFPPDVGYLKDEGILSNFYFYGYNGFNISWNWEIFDSICIKTSLNYFNDVDIQNLLNYSTLVYVNLLSNYGIISNKIYTEINNFNFLEEMNVKINNENIINLGMSYRYYNINITNIQIIYEKGYIIDYNSNYTQTNYTYLETNYIYSHKNQNLISNYNRIAGYIDYELSMYKFKIIPGIRLDYYQFYHLFGISPRLAVNYLPFNEFLLNIQIGRYLQLGDDRNVNEWNWNLNRTFTSLIDRGIIKSQFSEMWGGNIGAEYKIFENIKFDAQVYYKWLNNLLIWDDSITNEYGVVGEYNTVGKGYIYGIDLLIQKIMDEKSVISGWIGYSYCQSKRQNKVNGDYYDYDYEIPHSFKIVLNWKIIEGLYLSGIWFYNTGLPYTSIKGVETNVSSLGITNFSPIYSTVYNDKRLPDSHGLDLKLTYFFKLNFIEGRVYIEVINAYNRPIYTGVIYNYFNYSNWDNPDFYSTGIGIFPNIGFEIKF